MLSVVRIDRAAIAESGSWSPTDWSGTDAAHSLPAAFKSIWPMEAGEEALYNTSLFREFAMIELGEERPRLHPALEVATPAENTRFGACRIWADR